MASRVLSVLGDDRAGIVDALAAVVAEHGGNWERAQMTQLAGTFAGIVLVDVPDDRAAAMDAALASTATAEELDLRIVDVDRATAPAPATITLRLSGTDRPGVLREVTRVLSAGGVSIETLDTQTAPAPMAGGLVFDVTASLVVPDGVDLGALRDAVEAAVPGYLVDLDPAG